MLRILLIFLIFPFCSLTLAQKKLILKDSIIVSIHPGYDQVSKNHRLLFGVNYRKEWAARTNLPIIRISEIAGGLVPVELGGGHQSRSLHLKDKSGKEWVLRSVRKYTDGLAPDVIKGSIYEEWLEDNFSAQHPYAAIIVPVLAEAVNVPHTNPVIGWVAPDKGLGEFFKEFAGTVCLLEEREPEGESEKTTEMLLALEKDNNYRIDNNVFFRARLLDLLIADWGRHEDQWRWVDTDRDSSKNYLVVPRDRDQALYVNEGILTGLAAKMGTLSFLEGFRGNIKDPNAFYINGRNLNQQFLNQFTYEEWMTMTREFVSLVPDEVLRSAVRRLPASSYNLQGDLIFTKLKGRRDNLMRAMDTYYRFLYTIADVRTSDKAELAEFSEVKDGAIKLTIHSATDRGGKGKLLFDNTFDPEITREIRLFSGNGNDMVRLDIPSSKIKIRLIGGEGEKIYDLQHAKNNVDVYENGDHDQFSDPGKRFNKHLSNDTLNTQKVFSNLYLGSGITPATDIRSVDGIFLGLSYKIEKEGFRKTPYGSMHKIKALHSLSTRAFIVEYDAEWKNVFKNADVTINALADMKGNILNFFGRGNDTFFDRSGDFRRFYRVNFSFFKFDPALRISLSEKVWITTGPSFQYYSAGNNEGRFIEQPAVVNALSNFFDDKAHAGGLFTMEWDTRNDSRLPTNGVNFKLLLKGYEGLNSSSRGFAQLFPQMSFYLPLDKRRNVVLAERLGAGFTTGETTFYQSAFLGSQDNLLGFRKFRFAGDHVLYNNLEARINLPNFLHYFMPGKIGLIGFFDAGKVWVKGESSDTVHYGYGGGLYLTPFNKFFIRAVAGFSKEAWQPSVSLNQRF